MHWKNFLQNHHEAIAAMDFFTVPTLTFGILYCFFVIARDRRRILHFNVTKHPTDCWVCQQLRDAFPFNADYKYLIFDRDSKFGEQTSNTINTIGLEPLRTAFRSPWQNGVAQSDGSEAAGETCWTISSPSMSLILNGCSLNTWLTITVIAPILGSKRIPVRARDYQSESVF
jgi:hypothetical protein